MSKEETLTKKEKILNLIETHLKSQEWYNIPLQMWITELRGELQPISLDKETTYDEMMDNIRKDYPKEMAEVDEIRYCMYDTNARLYKKILEIIKR